MGRTEDLDYDLPPELIAQYPSPVRGDDRLLVVDRHSQRITHDIFADLPHLLRPGDLVVLNESSVIKARLVGRKPTGGAVELLLVRRTAQGWLAMVQARRGVRPGLRIELGAGRWAELAQRVSPGLWDTRFAGFPSLEAIPDEVGLLPLPPYIRRAPEPFDHDRYQTVYARDPGSVAAPTAGLHFTPEVLRMLGERGVEVARISLHVGPGTFAPIRTERLADHRLDHERYTIPEEAAHAIRTALEQGRRIVAVGTTVTRALEAAARRDRGLVGHSGWTDLFIYPPFEFRVIGALLTNFHLPRSSLLALVAAFAGQELVLAAYREAITNRYRFYSYGDAMLLT